MTADSSDQTMPDDAPPQTPVGINRLVWMPMALLGVTIVVYANSFWGVFVFDDVPYIVIAEELREPSPPSLFSRIDDRPLMRISLWANYQISQLEPWSYHAFNLAIHLLAGLVLFFLVRGTLGLKQFSESISQGHADGIAFASALIWLVHPLQTQAVTYTVQRGESMMALCYLLVLYSLLRGSQTAGMKKWVWFGLGVLAAWCGVLSKQVIVTVPVVALMYDRCFLAHSWRELVRRRVVFFLVLLILINMAVWPAIQPLLNSPPAAVAEPSADEPTKPEDDVALPKAVSAGFNFQGFSKWEYFRTQPEVLLHYLRLSLFPYELCLDYMWTIENNPLWIGISGFLILAMLVAGFVALWKRPWLGFLILSFFFVLAPTSSIMPINDIAVEHRMYLPLASLTVLVVLAGRAALARFYPTGAFGLTRPKLEVAVLIVVVTLLSGRTILRNTDYYSREIMWSRVIEAAPYNGRGYTNLGKYYVDTRQPEKAVPYYEVAHELAVQSEAGPYEIGARLRDIGSAYHDMGEFSKAYQIYSRAIELANGQDPLAFHSLGRILAIDGQFEKAERAFTKADALLPNDKKIVLDLANLYGQQGKFQQALPYFKTAKSLDPDNLELRMNYIGTLEAAGDVRQAKQEATDLLPLLEPGSDDYVRTKDWLEGH